MFSGRIYKTREGTYLAVYSPGKSKKLGIPKGLEAVLSKKAVFSYQLRRGGAKRNIHIFNILEQANAHKLLHAFRIIETLQQNKDQPAVDMADYSLENAINPSEKVSDDGLVELMNRDIAAFAASGKANTQKNLFKLGERLDIKTTKIEGKKFLKTGKGDFHDYCLLKFNIDLSTNCSAVLNLQGEIDRTLPCEYCYAKRVHYKPWELIRLDSEGLMQDLKGAKIVRVGKNTDAGHILVRENLMVLLEAAARTKTRLIIPTKFLEFNLEIAKLLALTRSHLYYSVGYDSLELGATTWGFDTDRRVEEAKQYSSSKVRTYLKIVTDITMPPEKKEESMIANALEEGLKVSILPVRIYERGLAEKLIGRSWEKATQERGQENLFGDKNSGGYIKLPGHNSLMPAHMESFWVNLIGDNTRDEVSMCGQVYQNGRVLGYCDKCHMTPAKGRGVFDEKTGKKVRP